MKAYVVYWEADPLPCLVTIKSFKITYLQTALRNSHLYQEMKTVQYPHWRHSCQSVQQTVARRLEGR